ncbi:MAG: patatin-like phospholipase family protein [Candidatus Doudnabacteria bacterium]|nr:patatin-like phospholipase family protein [Candidatus Doudnabacteria bacterium]
MSENNYPKIGLALSGSGSRMVFYIGFLEELAAQGVKIDYIAAMSGASIVAAAMACGTMENLKKFVFSLDKKTVMEMLPKGKGGLYSLDQMEEFGRKEITDGKRFEDVRPNLGFVASDIETGEQVVLSMGDISRAARISCTLPFFFEAVKWGDRTLVDGGLLNFIPVDVVRQAGMDVVVAVNMRGTKHLFSTGQLVLKRTYNFFKKALLIEYLERAWDALDGLDDEEKDFDFDQHPPMLSVLGRSMDLALRAGKKERTEAADLVITPDILNYRLKNIEVKRLELYELGKKYAREYAPKIKELASRKTTSNK